MKTHIWANACDAYWWIYDHPKLVYKGYVHPTIEITPHMVNPCLGEEGEVDLENPENNIRLRFWVELMYHENMQITDDLWEEASCHDWELDCGGWSWEEAVFNLAQLVLDKYGEHDE